jgi:gluconate kinase
MPKSHLHSQFQALEQPGADERPLTISIEPSPREIVARIVSSLKLREQAVAEYRASN